MTARERERERYSVIVCFCACFCFVCVHVRGTCDFYTHDWPFFRHVGQLAASMTVTALTGHAGDEYCLKGSVTQTPHHARHFVRDACLFLSLTAGCGATGWGHDCSNSDRAGG